MKNPNSRWGLTYSKAATLEHEVIAGRGDKIGKTRFAAGFAIKYSRVLLSRALRTKYHRR